MLSLLDFLDGEGVYQGPSTWPTNLAVRNPRVKSFGALKTINGDLQLYSSATGITSLNNIKTIRGSALLEECPNLKNLGTLRKVRDYIFINVRQDVLPTRYVTFHKVFF